MYTIRVRKTRIVFFVFSYHSWNFNIAFYLTNPNSTSEVQALTMDRVSGMTIYGCPLGSFLWQ